jgi:hypothetical protein
LGETFDAWAVVSSKFAKRRPEVLKNWIGRDEPIIPEGFGLFASADASTTRPGIKETIGSILGDKVVGETQKADAGWRSAVDTTNGPISETETAWVDLGSGV